MVRAAEDEAYNRGYRVLLCNTDGRSEKQAAYLEILAGERVSGVLLVASDPGGRKITQLLDLGIPVVGIDRSLEDPRADSVIADGTAAAQLGTGHLFDLGRRQIGYIGGPDDMEPAQQRRLGYELAVRERGLQPRVVDGLFEIRPAAEATLALLDGGPLDGLVIANNMMAIGAVEALRSRRVRIPEDVAVVAFDDPFWVDIFEPPLTTLGQPIRPMISTALELLLKRIRGGRDQPRRIIFKFDLRVLGSSVSRSLLGRSKAICPNLRIEGARRLRSFDRLFGLTN